MAFRIGLRGSYGLFTRPYLICGVTGRSILQPARPFHTVRCSISTVHTRPVVDSFCESPNKSLGVSINPRRSYSSGFRQPLSADRLFYGILGLNLALFGAFWYGRLAGDYKIQAACMKNFLLTPDSSPTTLISSGFFHISPTHLFFNMFTLKAMIDVLFYVAPVHSIGRMCLMTYLAGIVGGNLAMRNFGPWKTSRARGQGGALGASGGVTALLVMGSLVAPRMPMNIMFIPINIPLAVVAAGYLLIDAGYLNDARSTTGHAAHLGGGAVGALAFLFLRR